MKKLVHIFLFIGIINTLTFAELTKEDVDRYIDISRGGEIIKDRLNFRYKVCFPIMYGYDIKQADKKTIKKYQDFIFNSKNEEVFYKAFAKIDDTSYYEIMAFYKTDLGKKYTQGFKKIYDMDIQEELIKSILSKKNKILLPEKRELVIEINKELYSMLGLDLKDYTFFEDFNIKFNTDKGNSIPPKEIKLIVDEYIAVFSEFAYKDFSDNELSDILAYAKTYGKIEMAFLHHALKQSILDFKKDLKKRINNKKQNQNHEIPLSSKKAQTR